MGIKEIATERTDVTKQPRPQRRQLFALFTANIISYTGSVLTLLAIPWFVLQTTGSATLTGVTAFFSTLPLVISALLGNALVDRLGFRRTSVLSDIVSGTCVASIPLLAVTVGLAFWQLLVLVFLGGLCKMPGGIARSALVPDFADLASMRRERANAFADGIMRIAGSIGAPLAVLLIAFMGTKNLLWLDGASYYVSALIVGVLIGQTQGKKVHTANESGYLGQLGEGLRFILRDSVLWGVILVVVVTNLLDQALISVVAPTYIKQTFHSPIPLGWMYGVFGGMAFVGTVAFGAIGHRLPRQLTLGVGFTIGGAIRYWILLVPLIPLLVVAYAIAGLGIAPINPLIDTVLQERTPDQMRARVFGTTTAGAYIGIPIGALLGGVLVTYLGVQACLIIMGAVYFLATLSLLVNPGLKKISSPTPNLQDSN